MKALKCLLVWMVLFSLAGCEEYVLSLNPLSTDETSVAVTGFEGKWASDGQVWTVRPTDSSAYDIRISDMTSAALFAGRARRINTHLFLDLMPMPQENNSEVLGFYEAHWLPASSFMKMQLRHDAMTLERMNSDKLGEQLAGNPDLVKHCLRDNGLILTDETSELVQFVQDQVDVNDLWETHGEFVRCVPLYEDKDLIHIQGLTGQWLDPNESEDARFEIRTEGNHYGIHILSQDPDERMTFSAHLFKFKDWVLMGIFVGSEDDRAREMGTRLPDWFTTVTLEDDQLTLTIVEAKKVQVLLTQPEEAKEALAESEMTVQLVRQ